MDELKYNYDAKKILDACGISSEQFVEFQSNLLLSIKNDKLDKDVKIIEVLEKLLKKNDPATNRIICMYAMRGISALTNKILAALQVMKTMGVPEEYLMKMQEDPSGLEPNKE